MVILRFLQSFLDIALWRKGPQDLPASTLLATLALIAYMAIGFVRMRLFALDQSTALLFICVDALMLGGWLWLVLAFFGRRQRFVQTITAIARRRPAGAVAGCDSAFRAARLRLER